MRRWIGALAGLLLCSVAHAEIINVTPAASGGGGGSFPPTGCVTANGVIFNNATPCDGVLTYTGASGTGQVQIGGGTLAAGANTVFTINPASASGLLLDAQVGGVSQWKVSSAGATTQLGPVNITSGTITTNVPGVNITQTWNAAGTTFDAPLFIGVTNSASAAGSLLADLQVGGLTAISFGRDSVINLKSQHGNVNPAVNFFQSMTDVTATAQIVQGGNDLQVFVASTNSVAINALGVKIISGGSFGFSSGAPTTGLDTILTRAAAANWQFGTTNTTGVTAPTAQTISFQSTAGGASATNIAGADATVVASLGSGTGPSGKFIVKVGLTGTSGTTQNSPFPLLTLNPGAAATATVQFGDGTNFTTYDNCTALTTGATGIVACTASASYLKHIYEDRTVTPKQATLGLDKLRYGAPVWNYLNPEQFGEGTRVGLIADDVERMDPRCVVKRDGQVFDYWDRCVIAYLVADRQNLRAELDAIKRKVAR